MVKMVEDKEEFDALLVTAAAEDKLVVVDFTATWCPPCRMIAPIFAELATSHPEAILVKVDVDANAETAEACGISCMPTFQFFKGGEMVDKLEGASVETLTEKIVNLK
mmetsp:Transcript_1837/g.3754  ORF Transcript_1837/g.3754 Transcript_1837/m.3754 type:complete len:108 (+) Transcript_1837:61-384(+)|eukprot:CAMPEP_0182559362 /NCGR_PEP_ID=MMETSP1324-20130603/2515_1 /TAXON_ID=236786 /ORGANISM="Florenciella sp., Strain RCC1587" /LENGTH=107 /DNA_ID=CAMNT_0024771609 /DNA_START=22 /DNA_END=345 /DNA_ORIENTATION=-